MTPAVAAGPGNGRLRAVRLVPALAAAELATLTATETTE